MYRKFRGRAAPWLTRLSTPAFALEFVPEWSPAAYTSSRLHLLPQHLYLNNRRESISSVVFFFLNMKIIPQIPSRHPLTSHWAKWIAYSFFFFPQYSYFLKIKKKNSSLKYS